MAVSVVSLKPSHVKIVLREMIKHQRPALIVGAPGLGKTECVRQVCEELGVRLIISHPVVSDPTDYKGLPFPVTEGVEVPHAQFLPFSDLLDLIQADGPTVFFLDDLGQAPPSVQAACMQLLLARRVNGHIVSPEVTFLAATNRREDLAGVQGILEPVKSRFHTIINMIADLDDWCKWAIENNQPVESIAWLRFRPQFLHDFKPNKDMVNSPCPRTNANMGDLFKMDLPPEVQYATFSGAVGEPAAADFLSFVRLYQSMPDVDAVLMNPKNATLPDPRREPGTIYALCAAIAHRASAQNLDRVVEFCDRLTADHCAEFSVMLMKDALARNEKLSKHKAFVKWSVNHSNILT